MPASTSLSLFLLMFSKVSIPSFSIALHALLHTSRLVPSNRCYSSGSLSHHTTTHLIEWMPVIVLPYFPVRRYAIPGHYTHTHETPHTPTAQSLVNEKMNRENDKKRSIFSLSCRKDRPKGKSFSKTWIRSFLKCLLGEIAISFCSQEDKKWAGALTMVKSTLSEVKLGH